MCRLSGSNAIFQLAIEVQTIYFVLVVAVNTDILAYDFSSYSLKRALKTLFVNSINLAPVLYRFFSNFAIITF